MDTDSFIYEKKFHDVCEEGIKTHRLDTSDYPPDKRFNIPIVNEKVPGLTKDEANALIIFRCLDLRSKLYTFQMERRKCVTKSKGFEDYLECLLENVFSLK